jgi:CheY-like chemotaxis protein
MKRKIPKLLIVEDHVYHGPILKRTFESPLERNRSAFAIEHFVVDLADNRETAEELLAHAAQSFQPYDALLLDLEIPPRPGEKTRMDEGFKVLRAVDERSCLQVVINSIHIDLQKLHKLVQSGIYDYIIKKKEVELDDDDKAYTFQVVSNAYKKSALRLRSQWEEFLQERTERWRLVQTCAQMVDCVSKIVTDGVGRLREHCRGLGDLLASQYELRLERDADDPLCQAVGNIMDDASGIASELVGARALWIKESGSTDHPPHEENLEALVEESALRCLPGLALKGLKLNRSINGNHEARIFRHDVEMIIEELICNAVEASDVGQELSIRIDESTGLHRERTIQVCVIDEGERITKAERDAIAANRPLPVGKGRGWGLSLAQRVAETSGAWIDVKPGPTELGNTVTLHIPVAPCPAS